MSTICRDCEAIVVADDDVPADLVRIAMANHERFCKPGRREICDICDDVDFITSSETNIHAVLSRLTGFRSPTPGALAQHLTRHNRHDLTARLPGLHAAKPIATPSTQREEPTMNLQSVPEARPPAASLVDHAKVRTSSSSTPPRPPWTPPGRQDPRRQPCVPSATSSRSSWPRSRRSSRAPPR